MQLWVAGAFHYCGMDCWFCDAM